MLTTVIIIIAVIAGMLIYLVTLDGDYTIGRSRLIDADIDAGPFNTTVYNGGRYFKTTLKGGYDFLELAWHAAYSHLCTHKIKFDKKRPGLAVYENDPTQVEHTNQIITSLYIPVK